MAPVKTSIPLNGKKLLISYHPIDSLVHRTLIFRKDELSMFLGIQLRHCVNHGKASDILLGIAGIEANCCPQRDGVQASQRRTDARVAACRRRLLVALGAYELRARAVTRKGGA